MKYVILVCRILLGVLFFFFGLNNVLHFLHMPMPAGDAGALMQAMSHGWMSFVGCVMVVAGLLLLVGRFVPLALTLLAPVIVNILLFHFTIEIKGVVPGLIAAVLEVVLILAYWRSFLPLLAPDPKPDASKL